MLSPSAHIRGPNALPRSWHKVAAMFCLLTCSIIWGQRWQPPRSCLACMALHRASLHFSYWHSFLSLKNHFSHWGSFLSLRLSIWPPPWLTPRTPHRLTCASAASLRAAAQICKLCRFGLGDSLTSILGGAGGNAFLTQGCLPIGGKLQT